MTEQAPRRPGLSEDIRRLLAVLPAVSELLPGDPVKHAWVAWRETLLREVALLEARERDLQREPDLWIELSRAEVDAAGFDIDTGRDTRADLR